MMNSNGFSDKPKYISQIFSLPRGISRLEKLGTVKRFPKNHILVKAGEIPDCCYIVKNGRVADYEYTINGQERIYNIDEKGSMLLEANLLLNCQVPISFKTITPCELVCIEKQALIDAIHTDSEIAMDLIQSVSVKFISSMEQVRNTNYHNAEWKICELLTDFANKYGVQYDGKILIEEKMSQQMISNLLGLNRITVVRAIKALKEMGLIEQINGLYCIKDMNRLSRHQAWLLKSIEK